MVETGRYHIELSKPEEDKQDITYLSVGYIIAGK